MSRLRLPFLFVCALAACPAFARPRLVPISDTTLIAPKSSNPARFHVLGSQMLFVADDGTHGSELWRTDGTTAGTVLVKDITTGSDDTYIGFVGNVGTAAMFTVYGETSQSLWRTDGTSAGTFQVMEIPRPANPSGFDVQYVAADTRVFVLVWTTQNGPTEIWVADATVEGTRRIATLAVERSPDAIGINGWMVFTGRDASVGEQLWVSDGTIFGTHMVRRNVECPGGTCGPVPGNFFRLGNRVLFDTADGLWTTDGTAGGTVQFATITNAYLLAKSDTVAWLLAGSKLWVTDGTAAGTSEAGTIPWLSYGDYHVLSDGRLAVLRPAGNSQELWLSDGTTLVKKVTIQFSGSSQFGSPVAWLGDRLLLPGYSPAAGTELWIADPVNATAALLKDLDPRQFLSAVSSYPGYGGVVFGGRVFFTAGDFEGRELWASDGTANGTAKVKNIAPDPATGGVISGTVRDAGTGAPLAGATVRICPVFCEDFIRTDANGQYRFEGVTPGSYIMSAFRTGYLVQIFEGINCPCPDGAGAPVQVTSGFETTGVDFSLVKGGTITGTVTRASTGAAIASTVTFRDGSGAVMGQVTSHPLTGIYTSGALATGNYFVETRTSTFNRPAVDQVYNNHNCPAPDCTGVAGDPVAVTNGVETPNINFSLHEWGTIAGTIRDASNMSPIGSAIVQFTRVGALSSSTTVDVNADGTYLSPLLIPGSYYVRVYGESGYDSRIYPNLPCTSYGCDPSGGTPVVVAVDGATTGIDVALGQPKARLTGLVRDSNGAPLAQARISLLDSQGYYVSSATYSSIVTDTNGRFEIFDIFPGTYYFKAEDEVYPNVDCFNNQCDGHLAGATPLVLSAGETRSIETQLRSQRTTISGRILDAVTGLPIAGTVSLLRQNGDFLMFDRDANFEVSVISRDPAFYLIAYEQGYHQIAYPNVRMECTGLLPCPVPAGATALPAGTHTNIDMVLERFGAITGTVTDATTGEPIRQAHVYFHTTNGGTAGSVVTAADGTYRWQHANGSYYVYATAAYQQGQVYPGRNCAGACNPATGDLVTVADGGEVTGIDFQLAPIAPTGKITGRVVDDMTGAGMADVYVSARTPSGNDISTRTDAQGFYTIEDSDPYSGTISGEYRLYASAPNPYFLALYGGGICVDPFNNCNRNSGAPVQLNAPGTAANVDFRMVRLRITSISPAAGPKAGGTRVTISGANFPPGATVRIGSHAASIVSVTPAQIVIDTPSGNTGPAHVTVLASPSIMVTLTHGYTYFTTLTFTFTDDPVVAGVSVVKAVHITELRSAVNALRAIVGQPPYPFSDAVPSLVRAAHILELRTALGQARTAFGSAPLSYTNALSAGTPIRAIDINELRAGVR